MAATFNEKQAHTFKKYLTEQGMGVVKWSENHTFLWFHSYIFFRILHSQIVNLDGVLPLEEFVASFCKSCAPIPRKYMFEQDTKVSNWSEILNPFLQTPPLEL